MRKGDTTDVHNNFNSVLVDGIISRSGDYSPRYEGRAACLSFEIEHQHSRKADKAVETVSVFTVDVFGKEAERGSKKADTGRKVRVIGYLKSENNDFVRLIAEHVEYRKK